MEQEDKLSFFRELIKRCHSVPSWCYDENGDLLYCNADNPELSHKILTKSSVMEHILARCRENTSPFLFAIGLGLIWGCCTAHTPDGFGIYIIGPVFSTEGSVTGVEKALKSFEEKFGTLKGKWQFTESLRELPVLSDRQMRELLIMLEYTLSGQTLGYADIEYVTAVHRGIKPQSSLQPPDRMRTYQAERSILQMIRDGNLNCKTAMNRAIQVARANPYQGTALENARISGIIFTTLCSRAAIEGGVSPEAAYTLSDRTIRGFLECRNVSDVTILIDSMYKTYITLVHDLKSAPACSPEIQNCCDYIRGHPTEKILLHDLAERAGYTDYYLSKKFRAETGKSINQFILETKMAHAKILLDTTDMSLEDIAFQLQFCSRSYFTDHFTAIEGMSPSAYRKKL